mmetsp:Transcript_103082/g.332533  ORF Transcript_103082/g.332533 Transcript_103082/m.332533 type:complete len:210 (+) Transcript_103082:1409-2038(+)
MTQQSLSEQATRRYWCRASRHAPSLSSRLGASGGSPSCACVGTRHRSKISVVGNRVSSQSKKKTTWPFGVAASAMQVSGISCKSFSCVVGRSWEPFSQLCSFHVWRVSPSWPSTLAETETLSLRPCLAWSASASLLKPTDGLRTWHCTVGLVSLSSSSTSSGMPSGSASEALKLEISVRTSSESEESSVGTGLPAIAPGGGRVELGAGT